MQSYGIEYRAKCFNCSETYLSNTQWKVCPVCIMNLKQISAKHCKPVPKAIRGPKEVYTVAEVAEMMGLSYPTVIRLFENEPGVIILKRPEKMHKRGYRNIRIPHFVYERVRRRLEVK
jgi:hypothetical protein